MELLQPVVNPDDSAPVRDHMIAAAQQLAADTDALVFAEPTHLVYNPLRYAWQAHHTYLSRFADSTRKVVFLGMNPGPWGMAQTGVPFGEISAVRDWMGVHTPVDQPSRVHPKRPITGFATTRSEVSGRRLWGLFKQHFGTPGHFFQDHFVLNYCPLVFMEDSGKNRTPDKLPAHESAPLYDACDRHLRSVVQHLRPKWLIGVGKFAADRATIALKGMEPEIDWILHPSPASPAANRDWAGLAQSKLEKIGIW
jgi:single-strand selective monofunctional uracil DNA glycosylase